jgi:hypothetical protein
VTHNNKGRCRATHASHNAGIAGRHTAIAAVERKTIGRPTDYTPEIAREISDRMIDGNSLRAVC